MSLIILAGGKSSRMGVKDKALLPLGDTTMIGMIISRLEHLFSEIIIVSKDTSAYPGLQVVPDIYPGLGPISGIHAGLLSSSEQINLVLGCDLPLIQPELVEFLLQRPQAQVTIPQVRGYLEPLVAIYSKSIIPLLEKFIQEERYKLTDLYPLLRTDYVREEEIRQIDPQLESFLNVNSPEDYARVCQILENKNK